MHEQLQAHLKVEQSLSDSRSTQHSLCKGDDSHLPHGLMEDPGVCQHTLEGGLALLTTTQCLALNGGSSNATVTAVACWPLSVPCSYTSCQAAAATGFGPCKCVGARLGFSGFPIIGTHRVGRSSCIGVAVRRVASSALRPQSDGLATALGLKQIVTAQLLISP